MRPQLNGMKLAAVLPPAPYRCEDSHSSNAEQATMTKDKWQMTSRSIFSSDGPISPRDMGFSDIWTFPIIWSVDLGKQYAGIVRHTINFGNRWWHIRASQKEARKDSNLRLHGKFPRRSWTFAHYLEYQSPTWEVELKPVTAWSCSHGVDRWQDDCGCGGGGDWASKMAADLAEMQQLAAGSTDRCMIQLVSNCCAITWLARDRYIQSDARSLTENVSHFLSAIKAMNLPAEEQSRCSALLKKWHVTLYWCIPVAVGSLRNYPAQGISKILPALHAAREQ